MSQWRMLARHDVEDQQKEPIMTDKINPFAAAPHEMKAWHSASMAINASLDSKLVHLVEIRASQINGCANCLNMHTVFAREEGETEQRINLLPAWREAPCYTLRERAALAWTEALTKISHGHTHQAAYAALKAQFSEEEQIKLTLAINIINGWNRLAVGFGLWAEPSEVKKMAQTLAKAAA
jgi:AhpD family alkylhydroperoxidase